VATPDVPILTLCDALAGAVNDGWTTYAINVVGKAERAYQVPVKPSEMDRYFGRRVYVFPDTYANQPASKLEDLNAYRVAFLTIEKFHGTGPPDLCWVDDRVKFVYDAIFQGLDFSHNTAGGMPGPLAIGTRRVWTEGFDDVPVYDQDMLVRQKIFWCEMSGLFREIA
jgi:hypothetical protein